MQLSHIDSMAVFIGMCFGRDVVALYGTLGLLRMEFINGQTGLYL